MNAAVVPGDILSLLPYSMTDTDRIAFHDGYKLMVYTAAKDIEKRVFRYLSLGVEPLKALRNVEEEKRVEMS